MNIEETARHLLKLLDRHFWCNITVLALLFILSVCQILPIPIKPLKFNPADEMYIIVIAVMIIPIMFKIYHNMLKKKVLEEKYTATCQRFKKAYLSRLYILSILTVVNDLLYYLSNEKNFLWLTIVFLLIVFCCKPTSSDLGSMIECKNADEKEEKDE